MRFFYFVIISLFLQSSWAENRYFPTPNNYSLKNAFQTGIDTNAKPLFLCLAKIFNSTQPGKTWAGYGRCNVPYGGKEYIVDRFIIPPQTNFYNAYWQYNSQSPLVVGRDTNGNPLFLCQAFFQGSRQPGKTWPGYNHCNISYGGREIITNNYRVLTDNNQGHNDWTSQQCIDGPFGDKACGYNCIRSFNQVACANTPDQRCVADNFGHIACGYGCVKTPFQVACATRPWQRCTIDAFNEVNCS